MTKTFRTAALAAAAVTALAAIPASAMPITTPASPSTIVTLSAWATRVQGRDHTYAQPYGDGYGYGRGAYGNWGAYNQARPYGAYGRTLPPAYGYGDVYGVW